MEAISNNEIASDIKLVVEPQLSFRAGKKKEIVRTLSEQDVCTGMSATQSASGNRKSEKRNGPSCPGGR